MKKTYRILSFMMVLALVISLSSITAFAETTADIPEAEISATEAEVDVAKDAEPIEASNLNDLNQIFDDYYYSNEMDTSTRSPNHSVQDPYAMVEKGSIINSNKLIQTFSTNTNTKSELLELCKKILNGEKLADLITSDGELYTVTTDAAGNATGHAIIDMDDFSIKEFGELNEYTRKDFQLTKSVQTSMAKIKLDMATAKVVFCTINNFATGSLVYDNNNEYFIPSVESFESMGLLTVGNIYPVSDLANTIEKNIDGIFPINQVDEQGNPHMGAGTSIQPQVIESNPTNGTQSYIYFSIAGIIGALVCFTVVIKIKRKYSSLGKNKFL